MYDVYALEELGKEGYGNYRSLVRMEHNTRPDDDINGFRWVRIARDVNEDEAEAVMNQYPQVSRARC